MGIARKQIGNFTFKERTLVRKKPLLFHPAVNQKFASQQHQSDNTRCSCDIVAQDALDAFDKREILSVVCVNSSEQAR